MIIKIFALIGALTALYIIYHILIVLYYKITIWRKNDCKIKFLCDHIYELQYRWPDSGETYFICKKCGKKKKIVISPKVELVKLNEIFTGKNDETN